MLQDGPAQRVTIYMSESQRFRGHAAYMAVLEFLFYHGIAGATVTRGIAGSGFDHSLQSADILAASSQLPVKVEFLEAADKVQELLPKLREMAAGGAIAVQEAQVYVSAAPVPSKAHRALRGQTKLMRIYIHEKDQWNGKPLHMALVESLRAHDIAGATVYRGIAGFGAGRKLHKDGFLSHDMPITVAVVDTEAKIAAYLPVLDGMIAEGLVALSDVEVIHYTAAPEART